MEDGQVQHFGRPAEELLVLLVQVVVQGAQPATGRRVVRLFQDYGVSPAEPVDGHLGLRGIRPFGAGDGGPLQIQQLRGADAGAGQQHDEGDLRLEYGRHWSDQAALAVADKTDAVRVDLRPSSQVAEAGQGVVDEVLGSG